MDQSPPKQAVSPQNGLEQKLPFLPYFGASTQSARIYFGSWSPLLAKIGSILFQCIPSLGKQGCNAARRWIHAQKSYSRCECNICVGPEPTVPSGPLHRAAPRTQSRTWRPPAPAPPTGRAPRGMRRGPLGGRRRAHTARPHRPPPQPQALLGRWVGDEKRCAARQRGN